MNDFSPPPSLAVPEAIRKAEVLLEALGYIRGFRHRTVVIKLGGSVLEGSDTLDAILQDVVFMESVGLRPIVVHGGGKAISNACAAAGVEPRFVQGRRYTDDKTLKIVADVLARMINSDLCSRIDRLGGSALGLHHLTKPVLFGRPLELLEAGVRIDLGRVGEVTSVDESTLMKMGAAGVVPVLPSLAVTELGGLLNVNADTAAAAVAEQLKAEKLIFISDTPGVLAERDNESTLFRSLRENECLELLRTGVLSNGMIPKIEACLASLRAGVRKVHLVDGRVRHSLLLEIYTRNGVGTEIVL